MGEDPSNVVSDEQPMSSAVDAPPELPMVPPSQRSSMQKATTTGCLPETAQLSRKEKRTCMKRLRRKHLRQQAAEEEKLEENARLESTTAQLSIQLDEQNEAVLLAKEKAEHDEQERLWLERERKAMEDFQRQQEELKSLEEDRKLQGGEEDWRQVEGDGPAEIIWHGNEIIVRKRRVQVTAEPPVSLLRKLDACQPTSNPLPPQSAAFAANNKHPQTPDVSEQAPAFGTEQDEPGVLSVSGGNVNRENRFIQIGESGMHKDKTHCPFHIKTGVCRFGVRCSRVHVYPDQSFTLLMRNMYTGPGLVWENDEGLENSIKQAFPGRQQRVWWLDEGNRVNTIHSEEEVAQHYKEFYEDVQSEFLQFGELVNFKVCKNGSSHLRGNVYVHYKTEAGAQAAYSAMNGRFYAGKQITCEFVGVTRWRIALCGEFMKGHHRPCSHGSACNFLHCFRNPYGEYDWADWDSAPPQYWLVKMAKLFGYKHDLRQHDDDEYKEDVRRRRRYSESPYGKEFHRRERRNRDRFHLSTTKDFESVSRHTECRRHESRGEQYHSDADEVGESLRHRSLISGDSRRVSTSKEVDWGDRWNCGDGVHDLHSSEDAAVKDYHGSKNHRGQKRKRSYRTESHNTDEEYPDTVINEPRLVTKQHRRGTKNKTRKCLDSEDQCHVKLPSSRDFRDIDFQLSPDVRSRKSRHRSSSSEMENYTDQIVAEAEIKARTQKSRNGAGKRAGHTRKHPKNSHSRSWRRGSSDSDTSISCKRYSSHHRGVDGTSSTNGKSKMHGHNRESKKSSESDD